MITRDAGYPAAINAGEKLGAAAAVDAEKGYPHPGLGGVERG